MPTTLRCIDDVREWAVAQVRDAGGDEECVFAVELALAEALANIVRHSFREDPNQLVPVSLTIDDEMVRITIRDRGEPFDQNAYRSPELDQPRESGYGVYLIEEVMDEVIRERGCGETIITLVKRRTNEGGGDDPRLSDG